MNVSVPIQFLGRGATEAAGYQSVGTISKYQGGWQPHAVYPPYVPKNQAGYGHHLVVMPNNEVHGQVGQVQPGDDHTQLDFWAHMVDIPHVVAIHLGIC